MYEYYERRDEYESKDELYHHGVVGMKWGRRKARVTLSEPKQTFKEKRAATAKAKKDAIAQDPKTMTNKKLKMAIRRMKLEQQYNRLSGRDMDKGKARLENVLKVIGTTAAVGGNLLNIYYNTSKLANLGSNVINRVRR